MECKRFFVAMKTTASSAGKNGDGEGVERGKASGTVA
ncbi:hypothetical protein K788_00034795 (plasmid) [Paraburkholderia caribensis MBA4]|uniref:Uncharacterized protein n=1 Tax=Paraburkholderia caribensis MBA4 TaxID=1323664 RepID=A0A0N7JW43_9BURK|nr:hypothetical protein K788_00034795 [Paraburkholderia caribensis MBA4]